MLRNSRGLSLLRRRLGVQVAVDNHTIDDSLWSHGWDATKRAQNGQGPISVQTYGSRTRRRLLTDMQHLQTLQRRFPCRKKWTWIPTRTQTIVACGQGGSRAAPSRPLRTMRNTTHIHTRLQNSPTTFCTPTTNLFLLLNAASN